MCRGYNSVDVAVCEKIHRGNDEPRPYIPIVEQVYVGLASGLGAGLRQAGLDDLIVVLDSALVIALGDASAIERWRAGDREVFRAAMIEEALPGYQPPAVDEMIAQLGWGSMTR